MKKLTKKQEAELTARIVEACPDVIGHPIRLEHILRLIDNFKSQKRENGKIFHRLIVSVEGWFIQNNPCRRFYSRDAKFDLTKSFDEQSDMFKSWLYDLTS